MSSLVKDDNSMLDRFDMLAGISARYTGYVGSAGIFLLMLHVVADVIMRFSINATMPATLEVSQYWYLPSVVFLGLAVAYRNDDHISAPIIYDRLSAGMKLELRILGTTITLVFLAAMFWWGLEEALTQHRQGAIGIGSGIPIWQPRFFVPIGSALFGSAVLVGLLRDLLLVMRPKPRGKSMDAGSFPADREEAR